MTITAGYAGYGLVTHNTPWCIGQYYETIKNRHCLGNSLENFGNKRKEYWSSNTIEWKAVYTI